MTSENANIVNIKQKAVKATILLIGGDGLSQFIRLAGNLILTRLLVPEYFGLMAIAHVVLMAIGLFSDIGAGPGIIRSKRGTEPVFMNTAWTMEVLRGWGLWIFSLLGCYPASVFYDEPLLLYIIPIIGLSFVISGFNSMSIIKLNKELNLGKLVVMKLCSQISGLLIMIALAYFYRNVWSIVVGNLFGATIHAVWSHRLDKGVRHRFELDKEVFTELFNFGKWIFLSTAMMFLATQADRLILGKLFPLALLGVYSIAAGFAELPRTIVNTMGSKIIFPLISLYSTLPREDLRQKIIKQRKFLLYPAALMVAFSAGFGDILIKVLYDARYHEAGWILPLLALGIWPMLLYATIDRCLYVVDNPVYPALSNVLKFFYMIICLPLAYSYAGAFGAVLAIALSSVPAYMVINLGLLKHGLSGIGQDIRATVFLISLTFLIIIFRLFTGLGITGVDQFILY